MKVPEGVHTVQIVSAQSLIFDESQAFVQCQRTFVRHLGFQHYFVASLLLHRVDRSGDELRTCSHLVSIELTLFPCMGKHTDASLPVAIFDGKHSYIASVATSVIVQLAHDAANHSICGGIEGLYAAENIRSAINVKRIARGEVAFKSIAPARRVGASC